MKFVKDAVEYLLGGPAVGGPNEDRLRRWFALPDPDFVAPHARARYVVVHTETSGGDRRRERLLAIAAVSIAGLHVDLSDCFSVVLRQARPSAHENIVAHGIGGEAQLAGAEPKAALLDFLEYLRKSPILVFQADVERKAFERAVKSALGVPFRHPWIELSKLLPALFRETGCETRDAWLAHFDLGGARRGDPVADALASAQLAQIALDACVRAGAVNARQVIDLACAPG